MTDKSRKAFDFARGNMYMVDPLEVCIVGGLSLPESERGPHDTEVDVDHALFDERLDMAVDPVKVANVDAFGVIVPIAIAKYSRADLPPTVDGEADALAAVVEGRFRIRWARIVNRQRAQTGLAAMKVAAVMQRGDDTRLMGVMIAGNQIRTDDEPTTVIEKLKRYMERGVSLEDAAVTFGLKPSTAKQLIAYDDNAIPEVKRAVDSGKIAQTSAAEIARVKDPGKQRAALDDLLASPDSSTKKASKRQAKIAAKKAKRGADANVGVTDKRTQRKLFEAVEKMSHPRAGESTLAWWQGVEDALKLVTGDGDLDERLVKLLKEIE